MFCPKCGKELPEQSASCPECGAVLVEGTPVKAEGKQPYNVLAIVGLVLSALALCLDADSGLVVGIGGLVCAIIGLIQCNKKKTRGKVLAIIGIVLGAIAMLYPFM